MSKTIWGTSKRITLVISLIIMILILGVNLVSAESIGTFKQSDEMQITNYCSTADCTYANLTRIKLPNGTVQNLNAEMTQTGYNFNYSYTPDLIGTYYFTTCSNPTGENVCEEDSFEVTLTGKYSGINQSAVYIPLIILLFGIAGVFLFLTFKVESSGVKIFFLLSSFVFLIGTLALGHLMAYSSNLDSGIISTINIMIYAFGMIFFVVFAYIMINQIKEAVNSFREDKGYEVEF